jgi:hypothetical protein
VPVLHLGVADVPYNEPATKKAPSGETTGGVAELLEDKYHIMRIFFEEHKSDVALALENSLAGALENLLMGAPANVTPLGEGAAKIESAFKRFLEDKEMDRLGYPGVPTKASLLGISRRFKGKRGPPRPSFVDTSLYESSFKTWLD